MEIEINGKKYERTEKLFTVNKLMEQATGNHCAELVVKKFMRHFWDTDFIYHRDYNIPISYPLSDYIEANEQIMPWLVKHGFFREVEEEPQYDGGQWFKNKDFPGNFYQICKIGNNYCLIKVTKGNTEPGGAFNFIKGNLVSLKTLNKNIKGNANLIPIPPLIIIDRTELTEGDCVHYSSDSNRDRPCDRKYTYACVCTLDTGCVYFAVKIGTPSKDEPVLK